jgi:Tol biopolymer transport system component
MTADLQDLFDRAGRNPPNGVMDADAVLRRARRSRNRRAAGVVAATVVVTLALAVGLASQRRLSADPVPADPLPIVQPAGTLGQLAYELDGDIYVADADGKNPVRIADGARGLGPDGNCPGYWAEGPLWSPDGRYLAYRGDPLTAGDSPTGGCLWNRTVTISDPSGHIIASFPGDGWAIAWSPDSTRVAVWDNFYEDHTLAVYGLDGVRQALLDMPPGWDRPGDVDPVWSPDGASLLVPGGVEIPVDGSTPKQLPGDDPRSQLMATYSPDRTQIAYISREDGLGVAAADGSQARVLIPGELDADFPWAPYGLSWSPTGDRIAFVQKKALPEGGRANELAVLDVASGSVVPLADMGPGQFQFQYVEFAPEGDQILFTRTDATGARSLWSVHADGSNLQRLVDGSSWGDWQTLIPTRSDKNR